MWEKLQRATCVGRVVVFFEGQLCFGLWLWLWLWLWVPVPLRLPCPASGVGDAVSKFFIGYLVYFLLVPLMVQAPNRTR